MWRPVFSGMRSKSEKALLTLPEEIFSPSDTVLPLRTASFFFQKLPVSASPSPDSTVGPSSSSPSLKERGRVRESHLNRHFFFRATANTRANLSRLGNCTLMFHLLWQGASPTRSDFTFFHPGLWQVTRNCLFNHKPHTLLLSLDVRLSIWVQSVFCPGLQTAHQFRNILQYCSFFKDGSHNEGQMPHHRQE